MKENELQFRFEDAFRRREAYAPLQLPAFRGSALPICAIQWVLTTLLVKTSERPIMVKNRNIWSDYYLNAGNLLHQLFQKYAGANKIVWGKWKCASCKKVIGPKLGSEVCCGQWMDYVEFTTKHKQSGLIIHIDIILKLWGFSIIGDFKTSKHAWDKNFVNPNNYYHQLNSYVWVMEDEGEHFDIAAFLYLPRDLGEKCLSPSSWKFSIIKPDKKLWLANIESKDKAEECIKYKNWSLFKDIVKEELCKEEDGKYCRFFKICHPQAHIKRMEHYKELWQPWRG